MMFNEVYNNKEFYMIAEPILRNKEFQRRKKFLHHYDSVYNHSLKVAYTAYRIAKVVERYKKININNVVISALLHDFYTTPWREYKTNSLLKKHGFVHGKIAASNSYMFFPSLMNKRIENAIKRHMFPLTIMPPKYIEGWIITLADKYVSLDVFKLNQSTIFTKDYLFGKCKQMYFNTEKFVSHIV